MWALLLVVLVVPGVFAGIVAIALRSVHPRGAHPRLGVRAAIT